jgi:hypothetical protein
LFEARQLARLGHKLRQVQILAVRQRRRTPVKCRHPRQRQNHANRQRHGHRLGPTEECLARHQPPEPPARPRQFRPPAELTIQPSREYRAPAVHPNQQQCQRERLQRASRIGRPGCVMSFQKTSRPSAKGTLPIE